MTPFRPWVFAACVVYLSVIVQGRLSHVLHVQAAQPDFPLLTLACAGVLLGGSRATVLGLWTGLLTAAMLPSLFGTILTTRILAGAFAGFLTRFMIRDSVLVPPLAALTVTLLMEIATVLIDPSLALQTPRAWLAKAGGEIVYNALLAVPAYFLLRKLGVGVTPEDPFRRMP